jgi:hypothetical protein
MLKVQDNTPVFLACGDTDMRKSINGLASIVENSFALDPFDRALFVFCNRQRNRLKILTWEDIVLLQCGTYEGVARQKNGCIRCRMDCRFIEARIAKSQFCSGSEAKGT